MKTHANFQNFNQKSLILVKMMYFKGGRQSNIEEKKRQIDEAFLDSLLCFRKAKDKERQNRCFAEYLNKLNIIDPNNEVQVTIPT